MESKKRRRGRPEHVPTPKDREIVAFAVGIGATEVAIAQHIGINKTTLLKYYREELDQGLFRLTMNLARKGYQTAMGNGPHAAAWGMFLLKTRAGWKEVTRQENTGANGGPGGDRAFTITIGDAGTPCQLTAPGIIDHLA